MLTMSEYAERAGLTRVRIHQLILQGRIPGARLIGNSGGRRGFWMIPAKAKIKVLDNRKGRA